jgi:N utilization substance protein B
MSGSAPRRPARAPDTATRHQSRERALSLLYEAEMKGIPGTQVLHELVVAPDPFAEQLVRSAEQHRAEADERIGRASEGWPLDRMAVVDRLVMRLAVSELLDPAGPSVAVVIDEAVELAKTYSTDESGRFVNGILSSVAADVRGQVPPKASDGATSDGATSDGTVSDGTVQDGAVSDGTVQDGTVQDGAVPTRPGGEPAPK